MSIFEEFSSVREQSLFVGGGGIGGKYIISVLTLGPLKTPPLKCCVLKFDPLPHLISFLYKMLLNDINSVL